MSLRPRRRPRFAATAVSIVVLALLTAGSAAAANPFLHDVDRVNGHLRVAIEFAPEELGEALGSAEVVCGLGERAASHGEPDVAAADWSTLKQLVDEFATGSVQRVQTAFANADSVLLALRERYERRWQDDPRVSELRRGVRTTHQGIRLMSQAIAGLDAPFTAWRAHDCAAANAGVEKTLRRIPTGLRLIDLGMLRLWRLAGLIPGPAERSA